LQLPAGGEARGEKLNGGGVADAVDFHDPGCCPPGRPGRTGLLDIKNHPCQHTGLRAPPDTSGQALLKEKEGKFSRIEFCFILILN
jgi:hypothetical protein